MDFKDFLKLKPDLLRSIAKPDAIYQSTITGNKSNSARAIVAERENVNPNSLKYRSELAQQADAALFGTAATAGVVASGSTIAPTLKVAIAQYAAPAANIAASLATQGMAYDMAQKSARILFGDDTVDSVMNTIEPVTMFMATHPLEVSNAFKSLSSLKYYAQLKQANHKQNKLPIAPKAIGDSFGMVSVDHFNNPNKFYRVVTGDASFNDIVESGVVRARSGIPSRIVGGIDIGNRSTPFPSFSKGSAAISYARGEKNHYIIETIDQSFKPSTLGRHGKGTTMFPTDINGDFIKSLPGNAVNVYKHLGDGMYELVYLNGKVLFQPKATAGLLRSPRTGRDLLFFTLKEIYKPK
jgi:hypothetical protein